MSATRPAPSAHNLLRVLVPLAAFAALVALIDVSDWNEGVTRAAALAVVGGALALLAKNPLPPLPRHAAGWLAVATVAVVLHFVSLLPLLRNPHNHPNDIGTTTQAAVRALQHGQSVYRSPIDDQYSPGQGLHYFGGYKYGPIVPRFYFQFMRVFGETNGLYAGNAFLLLALVLTIGALAWRAAGGSPIAAGGAALLLLWPRFVHYELFVQGVNDLLPTTLATLGVFGCLWSRPLAAGILVGLSLACKPLPGALLVPLLPWRSSWRRLAAGLALGLATLLPDFVRTPRELLASLVLFNLGRASDSTSLVNALPPWARIATATAGLALIVALIVAYQRRQPQPRDLVSTAALTLTVFLVVSKVIHRNYILWWLPFATTALAATCYRATASPSDPRPE
jgi:hypothetical protein